MIKMRKYLLWGAGVLLVLGAMTGGAVSDRLFGYRILDKWLPRESAQSAVLNNQKVLYEENVVIEVAEKVSPSVVTVGIKKTQILRQPQFNDFFSDPSRLITNPDPISCSIFLS